MSIGGQAHRADMKVAIMHLPSQVFECSGMHTVRVKR